MRILRNLRTPFIALTAVIAMLLVPACGSLCAAMTHCSTGAASASSDSDSCHHTNMTAPSDSETYWLSSDASCGQQAPLLAILAGSDSSIPIGSTDTADPLPSIDLPIHAVASNSQRDDFLPSKESPQSSIPLENLSVLRI
jgi:hypothetical protein